MEYVRDKTETQTNGDEHGWNAIYLKTDTANRIICRNMFSCKVIRGIEKLLKISQISTDLLNPIRVSTLNGTFECLAMFEIELSSFVPGLYQLCRFEPKIVHFTYWKLSYIRMFIIQKSMKYQFQYILRALASMLLNVKIK